VVQLWLLYVIGIL